MGTLPEIGGSAKGFGRVVIPNRVSGDGIRVR